MAQLCMTTNNAQLHMMRSAFDRQFSGNPCSTQAAPVFNSLLTMHALHREETNPDKNDRHSRWEEPFRTIQNHSDCVWLRWEDGGRRTTSVVFAPILEK